MKVEDIKRLQALVGVPQDGSFGPQTLAATLAALERVGQPTAPPPPARPEADTAAGGANSGGMRASPQAAKLMHEFEGCELAAYPDPGSSDGNPWTIGFGATGPGIHKGVTWTREQAERRFAEDLARFSDGVVRLLDGAPTKQHQLDALTSFAYNVGLGALASSTLLRKHKAGDFAGAADQFARWNKNDGREMRGLSRRRAAEAALYRGAA